MVTPENVAEILKRKSFDDFIGLKEGDFFEAKEIPYESASAYGRFQLTKVVSSLAHAQGGYVVFGLKQERILEENVDKVVGLTLLSETEFPAKAYEGICRQHIYPEIIGLEIGWIECGDTAGKGVGFIFVPTQSETLKPFLSSAIYDGEPIKQIVFGVALREKDASNPLTIEKLHEMLQNGKGDVAVRLTQLDEKMEVILEHMQKHETPSAASPSDKLGERVKAVLEADTKANE